MIQTFKSLRPYCSRAVLWRMVLFPTLFYFAFFVALTYPAICNFSSHLWAGAGDGLAIFWNIWWVDKALVDLHQHPWTTPYLFHPLGADLYAHTMHPLKGMMGIPLMRFMTPETCYNTLLIQSFVATGVTMFWAAMVIVRSYWPSILAGFIFTFCSYHFAHAQGHLHLISLEWLPVFVVIWHRFLLKPCMLKGAFAALTLFLIFLCDAYYFLYGVMIGTMMVACGAWRERSLFFFLKPDFRKPLLVFVVCCLATSGVLTFAILSAMKSDPMLLFPAYKHSMDLLAPIIPGFHWRFASLTDWYWTKIPGKLHGNSLHIGLSVIAVVAYAITKRKSIAGRGLGMWICIALAFSLFALGPRLYIAGWEAPFLGDPYHRWAKMPYWILEKAIPGLMVGARPNRMFIMAVLCIAMAAGFGFKLLLEKGRTGIRVAWVLFGLMVFEYLPSPLPALDLGDRGYGPALAAEEGDGAVYDPISRTPLSMYYQTMHEHPIADAWISRVPLSARQLSGALREAYDSENYRAIRDTYDYRYVVVAPDKVDAVKDACGTSSVIYQDDLRVLMDLFDADTEPGGSGL